MRLSTTPLDAALSPWAERLRQRLNLPLLVRWSGGSGLRLGDFEQPRVVVDVRDAAGAAALLSPSLDHLGRAYVEGHIDVSGTAHDIMDMAHRLAVAGSAEGPPGWVQRIAHRVADAVSHTRAEDRAAIQYHYDVSNAFYAEWLDPAMVYSCAYFERGDETLAAAQQQKIDHILTKLRLQPGQTLLDIGCGWGALVLRAAEAFGARCVGITLSQNQFELATERVRAAGLGDRIDIRLQDYRDVRGPFDRISSVGMFEHVGRGNFDEYFAKTNELLADDGVMLTHTIGLTSPPPGVTDKWSRTYIFPGHYLPSLSEMVGALERTRWEVGDVEILRYHYAHTLAEWYRRTTLHEKEITALYDARMFRMWQFYLVGAEQSFRGTGMVNFHIQSMKRRDAVPMTRDYISAETARLSALEEEPEWHLAPKAREAAE